MHDGILSAVGMTPLVRLRRLFDGLNFNLYAKLEALNPGGSTKDRPAMSIITRGFETGFIKPETVVIESSSGNMGVGLAQACAYYGLRFICVVDPKTTAQNIRLLRAYGAEVDVVKAPDPTTGEYLQARIARVEALRRSLGHSFWPNQYANLYNPIAHHRTMGEIAAALDGRVDYLFCATSTCGTLRGCVEYVTQHGLPTKVFAVDALGSVIFGGRGAKRLIPGHGAAIRPQLYEPALAECVHVSDPECVVGCRRLVKYEAILAGGSSGAVVTAVSHVRHRIRPGSNCVVIFADRGERYLDTIYSDEWVEEHFGDISEGWRDYAEPPSSEPLACVGGRA
jgi:2,3-diaminopropionate biosynthesis protein SbnA